MNFDFSEEHQLFKDALERLVAREIEPLLASCPADAPLPRDACVRIREILHPMGIQGARVPVELGGSGLGAVGLGIAAQTIPYEAFELVMCIEAVALRIALAGTDEMKSTVLPELLAGRAFAGSATSEPDVGSDPRGIRTRATLEGDRYVLNGTKLWVSAGTVADYLLVMASTGRDHAGNNVISPFLVNVAESPVVARSHDLMGIQQSHIAEIHLDHVGIPRDNMLAGAAGHAHTVLTSTWLSQRPVQALCNVRLADKAYEAALQYSLQREQFGKPIASFQLVQDMLAEMRTLIDCSKLLCYRSLTLSDEGKRPHLESSMAKLFACQSALRVTNLAVEVHGAFGATRDFAVEKYFRDERVLAFPDGTINIQKLIVGRELTGIRAFS